MSANQATEMAQLAPNTPSHDSTLKEEDMDKMEPILDNKSTTADVPLSNGTTSSEAVEAMSTDDVLKDLTEGIRNQEDIQRDITAQATLAFNEQEDERDKKRIEKAALNRDRLLSKKHNHARRLDMVGTTSTQKKAIAEEMKDIDEQIAGLENDMLQSEERIQLRHVQLNELGQQGETGTGRLPNESQRDFLIRTGKITPFSRMPARPTGMPEGELATALYDAEEAADLEQDEEVLSAEPRSHQFLRKPGFADLEISTTSPSSAEEQIRPRKKQRTTIGSAITSATTSDAEGSIASARKRKTPAASDSAYTPDVTDDDFKSENDDDADQDITGALARVSKDKKSGRTEKQAIVDDGDESAYQKRLHDWEARRSKARRGKLGDADIDDGEQECFKRSPDAPDHLLANGLKLPGDIYPALYDYQKTGVQWLGELYNSQVGGIVGDEMGLGKTIQVVSFIAALHYSKKLDKPVIVVAPATVLQQWVNEFHTWWPALRVSILHTSGSGMLNIRNESRIEEEDDLMPSRREKKEPRSSKAAKRIVDRVVRHGHVLVTTYAGLQTYGKLLVPIEWAYAVLDEGHKIRNPNTTVTIYCKELQTPNRIILSGTPLQNNLIELWSLFDFIYPMRLGTLVNFRNQFEIPIKLGGYANATNLQILTATKCAETLKEAIGPYLLQRLKVDVASDLPKKTEQVIFCKLTKPQRDAYEQFLKSDDMTSILNRTRQSLYGIDILRKICNHPDLLDPNLKKKAGYKWGNPNKSGKMHVVKALIEKWKKEGDKALLFSQGVQMLNIIEDFVKSMGNVTYLRMDGGTAIKDRQPMVTNFNENKDIDLFLLTTKVGGLGVNLTGANRVIIFDPDWNPSTDVQARERAWRLGQKKEVTIFRLMTVGTIEEKIYHRQIFKQFLSDKILRNPSQRQTFHMKDLHDLFTLGSTDDGTTETGEIFQGSEVKFNRGDAPAQDHSTTDALPPSQLRLQAASNAGQAKFPQGLTIGQSADISSETGTRPVLKESDAISDFAGVAKVEDFHDEDEGKTTNEEARIMEGIFARAGVHSVLQHDRIVNGRPVVQADRAMNEREASRIAAEAAAELRRASEAARHIPIGTVTWTGEVGEGGRPAVNRRRGPGAGNVLQSLGARQSASGIGTPRSSPGSSRSGTPGGHGLQPRGADFLKLIRDYIHVHGGSVPTQMLIVHFNNMCRTPQQSNDFQVMLHRVADPVASGANGRKRWVLKEEYR